MQYIIDGYNLLFKVTNNNSNLEQNRKEILESLKPIFSNLNNEIKIIFDGKGMELSFESFHEIQIIFTPKNMSADDYILEVISTSLHPANATIVSSDKRLTIQCKYYGSKIMTINSFLKWAKSRSSKEERDVEDNFQDSKKNIDRLNKIFEKRLKNKN